jgi:CheY-like chemotaxis protein
MGIPVLIVNSDPAAREKLRQPLESAGYPILEADDVEDGLAMLHTSEGAIVTLFKVALFNNIISGTDGIAFLGAARYDARHGRKHAFVVVTPTPDQLQAALGRLLAHLSIPVLAEPFSADDLVNAVDQATRFQFVAV